MSSHLSQIEWTFTVSRGLLAGTKRSEAIGTEPEFEESICALLCFKAMKQFKLHIQLFDNILHNVGIPG